MQTRIQILDVIAITQDIPDFKLVQGQVGTIVEELGHGVFEVEFCDNDGRTYATVPVQKEQLIVLHYSPVAA